MGDCINESINNANVNSINLKVTGNGISNYLVLAGTENAIKHDT